MSAEQEREALLASARALVDEVIASGDVGLPFAPAAVETFARLRRVAEDDWQRLRLVLKSVKGVVVSTLDKMIAQWFTREAQAATTTATTFGWPTVEDWPERVNGGILLNDLEGFFSRHAVLPKHGATVLPLWTVAAHAHDSFDVFPRLALTSPTRRCGKTTVLDLLSSVAPRPLVAANATPAAIFRSIEQSRPTLLLDEADTFLAENLELRGILNSGHTRAGFVLRTVGDDFKPRQFSTWAPLAVACIGSLPATLADRSVSISMQRKSKGEETVKFRPRRDAGAATNLRRRAARFATDNATALAEWEGSLPDVLFNRIADNWSPLFAVAALAGGEWPRKAELAALADAEAAADSDEYGELVLGDLLTVFAINDDQLRRYHDRLPTETLLNALRGLEERPWSEYGRAKKPLGGMQLAKLLKPFGISSKSGRYPDDLNRKGYERKPIEQAYHRYKGTPFEGVTPSQPAGTQGFGPDSEPTQDPPGDASENAQNASFSAGCDGVTATQGGSSKDSDSRGDQKLNGQPRPQARAKLNPGPIRTHPGPEVGLRWNGKEWR